MWTNPEFPVDLVTFTKEILNPLCSVRLSPVLMRFIIICFTIHESINQFGRHQIENKYPGVRDIASPI